MDAQRFEAMVARLEKESAASPRGYVLRVLLLTLLGFGLMLLLLGAAGLGLLILGGVVVAAVLTGGGAILALLKLGKLLLLLALPLWFLVKSTFKALFFRLPAPQGTPVTPAQAPVLFAAIAGMRRKLRGPRVHQVLLVNEVNAAIVQRPLFGLVGFPRNHLLLGLPLLESMTPDEALAVVAHEYGHLAGSHGRFGAYIYRLRLTWGTIQAVAEQWQGFAGRWLGKAVGWYAPYFNAYTFVLARANEYQADLAAAELVGAPVMAAALKRVNVASPQYQAFMGRTFEAVAHTPQPPQNLAHQWAGAAALLEAPAQQWLAEALDRQGQVADTHPALRLRLGALPGVSDHERTALPPERQGPSAAEAWLGEALPAIRQRFESLWAEGIAPAWAERHGEILQQRERLASLRGQAERSQDEDLERLRLSVALEPGTDWRDEVAAFNVAHPQHAGGLYLAGVLHLNHDDEAGLALLEQAMALDADAIKPACERAHAFWRQRKDETQAKAWAGRWQQRQDFETARQQQARQLHIGHRVQSPDLSSETRAAVAALLTPAALKDVKALYLVRRVLPADPTLPTYVLGVDLTWWARRRGRQQQVVDRLAALGWPMHLVLCTLDGRYKAYGKLLRAVPGARWG